MPAVLRAPRSTIGSIIEDALRKGIAATGVSERTAARWADKATRLLSDVSPVGSAQSFEQAGRDFKRGRYGAAAGNAALGALGVIPGAAVAAPVSKAARAAQKVAKRKPSIVDVLKDEGGAIRAWHGSPRAMQIDALRPSGGGELGPGVYFSKDRPTAAGYAISSSEDATPHAGLLELDIEGLNIAEIKRQEWLQQRSEIMDKLRSENGGEWRGEFYDEAMRQLEGRFKAQGFDGLYDDWRQGIIFPDRAERVRITGKARR